jgi:hypothetical protein
MLETVKGTVTEWTLVGPRQLRPVIFLRLALGIWLDQGREQADRSHVGVEWTGVRIEQTGDIHCGRG